MYSAFECSIAVSTDCSVKEHQSIFMEISIHNAGIALEPIVLVIVLVIVLEYLTQALTNML